MIFGKLKFLFIIILTCIGISFCSLVSYFRYSQNKPIYAKNTYPYQNIISLEIKIIENYNNYNILMSENEGYMMYLRDVLELDYPVNSFALLVKVKNRTNESVLIEYSPNHTLFYPLQSFQSANLGRIDPQLLEIELLEILPESIYLDTVHYHIFQNYTGDFNVKYFGNIMNKDKMIIGKKEDYIISNKVFLNFK